MEKSLLRRPVFKYSKTYASCVSYRKADVSHAAHGLQYLLSAPQEKENLMDKAPGSNPEDIGSGSNLIEGLTKVMSLCVHPARLY